jgi:hypothetical protein
VTPLTPRSRFVVHQRQELVGSARIALFDGRCVAMTQILILASCVYLSLLVAAIYFTRASARRVVGALIGGVAVALVGAGVEAFAHARAWWSYPSNDTPISPVGMYPALVVVFAFLALIGWTVARRFGWRGTAVFLSTLAIVGTLRDNLVAAKLVHFIEFAPGVWLMIIDGLLWAGLTVLALAVMPLVSGPARIERPASRAGDVARRAALPQFD